MPWHFPILVTIRDEPFKKYRSRTAEMCKAKEDKLEEVKKKKKKTKKRVMMNGTMPNGNHHHLGHGNSQ